MKLKRILEDLLKHTEQIGTLIIAVQAMLISKGYISEEQLKESLPLIQQKYQEQLSALYLLISQLPEHDRI